MKNWFLARAYPERLVDAEIGKVKFSHNKAFINIEQSKSAGIPLILNLIITLIVTFMVTLMVALMVILMVIFRLAVNKPQKCFLLPNH